MEEKKILREATQAAKDNMVYIPLYMDVTF